MWKKILTYLSLGVCTLMLAIGCTANNPKQATTSPRASTLSIYGWTTYIHPDVFKEFEQKNNVKIKYDTFDSNEALYAKLKSGNPGYDLTFPSDYMVKTMIKENMLEPLNLDKIPNRKNLETRFQNLAFDPNNKHSIPYLWGTNAIGYNIKATGKEIDSWAELFDPKYKGRIALLDDMRATFGTALIYLGLDPNTTKKEDLDRVKELYVNSRENFAAFAPDTGQDLLMQKQVDIVVEYNGDIIQIMEENPDIRVALPKEGSLVYVDNMTIPKGAPNREMAEKFINFMLEPEVGAKNANFRKYPVPNQVAIDRGLIEQKNLKNPNIYPPADVAAKLRSVEDLGSNTKLYDDAWTELKVSLGK